MHLPDENEKRFVAVLNKQIEIGRLLNALGHMTAGLVSGLPLEDLCFLEYQDLNQTKHPNISHYPFIVLRADNSSKLRSLRNEVLSKGLAYTDFVSTMILGTSAEQLQATKMTSELELEYYGVCFFGDTLLVKELTRKFSLFN